MDHGLSTSTSRGDQRCRVHVLGAATRWLRHKGLVCGTQGPGASASREPDCGLHSWDWGREREPHSTQSCVAQAARRMVALIGYTLVTEGLAGTAESHCLLISSKGTNRTWAFMQRNIWAGTIGIQSCPLFFCGLEFLQEGSCLGLIRPLSGGAPRDSGIPSPSQVWTTLTLLRAYV